MKKFNLSYMLVITISLLALQSCDLPSQSRDAYIEAALLDDSSEESQSSQSSSDTQISTTDSSQSTTNLGEGFERCVLDKSQYNAGQIGGLGICRHSSDSSRFKVIFNNTSADGTCFVPTYKEPSTGASYKLGIAECVRNQADTIYDMTLTKELMPPYFNTQRTEPINSVMVLTAAASRTYMSCMVAKESYLLSAHVIPGNLSSPPCCLNKSFANGRHYCSQSHVSCEQAANQYAQGLCYQFTQHFQGQFQEINF